MKVPNEGTLIFWYQHHTISCFDVVLLMKRCLYDDDYHVQAENRQDLPQELAEPVTCVSRPLPIAAVAAAAATTAAASLAADHDGGLWRWA